MVITKICPICKNEFETDRNAKRYCSDNCTAIAKAKATQKPERTFVCEYCEKEFKSVRKRKFCSSACRDYNNGRLPDGEKKRTASLSEVLARAKAEGITYGECVQKYGYE